MTRQEQIVLKAISRGKVWRTKSDICDETGIVPRSVGPVLWGLKRAKLIVRDGFKVAKKSRVRQ